MNRHRLEIEDDRAKFSRHGTRKLISGPGY